MEPFSGRVFELYTVTTWTTRRDPVRSLARVSWCHAARLVASLTRCLDVARRELVALLLLTAWP